MLKRIICGFKPLLTNADKLFARVNGIAARNISWRATYATRELAVTDEKVTLLLWCLEHAVRHCIDKDAGEMFLETRVP